MKICVVGAGVGGLTLVLSLLKNGFSNIHLYESSHEISELGVGINILPHAMKVLDGLGLVQKFLSEGVECSELIYLTSKKGQTIWREHRGLDAGYKWPQISINRGKLITILYDEVTRHLKSEQIHTNHRLLDFKHNNDGSVTAFFGNGSFNFDCLIACDGIHSTVRKKLFPDEGSPKWNGITMWRGVTAAKPVFSDKTMVVAGISEHRIVLYPISNNRDSKGRLMINWVAKHKTDGSQRMPRENWNHQVDKSEVFRLFKEFDFLNVPELIDNAEEIFKYPVLDRDPLPSWNFAKVTLLGDAAHPMYPSGSNGASQAILDAGFISQQLASKKTIAEAILSYDKNRRLATNKITEANRHAAPERCIDIVQKRAPEGFITLDDVITQKELKNISQSYKKIAGFDPSALNEARI